MGKPKGETQMARTKDEAAMKILENNDWRTIWTLMELFGVVDSYGGGGECGRRTREGLAEGWLEHRRGKLWVAPQNL
jgi:hypothetical protein